ncbi:MAG: type III-A CRISPR-associated protein Csm2, partial [Candidatus Cloacimonadales bacterium]|nr:type III-A CRISPR-associated protein Csm2 [Candidatus Cloacimonadales bacterium]
YKGYQQGQNRGQGNQSFHKGQSSGHTQKANLNIELKNFFTDDGLIDLDWINTKAKEFAEFLGRERDFSTTQLRNFYHEYLRIQSMPAKKEEKIIQIKMLKAKVSYKSEKNKVPEVFVDFTINLIDEIKTNELFDKYFNNACILMEALVAYNPKK